MKTHPIYCGTGFILDSIITPYSVVNKFSLTPVRDALIATLFHNIAETVFRNPGILGSTFLNGTFYSEKINETYTSTCAIAIPAAISTLLAYKAFELTPWTTGKIAILSIHRALILGCTKNRDGFLGAPSLEGNLGRLARADCTAFYTYQDLSLAWVELISTIGAQVLFAQRGFHPVINTAIALPLSTIAKVFASKVGSMAGY
ncbi:MAG: hypothetical protein ACOYK9_03900 [Chlamydiia bacterium]